MKNKTLANVLYISLAGTFLSIIFEDAMSYHETILGIFAWGWIISSIWLAVRLKKIED